MNLELIDILIAKGEYIEKQYGINQTIHNDRVSSNTLYFIKSGMVSINRLDENGDSNILILLGSEDFFGLRSILYPLVDEPVFSLSKSERTIIYEFHKKIVLEYFNDKLLLNDDLCSIILNRMYLLDSRIDILIKPKIKNRLLFSMLDIEQRFKNTLHFNISTNCFFYFPLSHSDLGKYCRGARENICKAAHQLKKKSRFIEQAIKSRVKNQQNLS